MTRDPLQVIPGIGPSMADTLRALGYEGVEDLEGRDPDEMYTRMKVIEGAYLDRCVLYGYRCAVYYAEGGRDPELLEWWRWKDAADPPLELLRVGR